MVFIASSQDMLSTKAAHAVHSDCPICATSAFVPISCSIVFCIYIFHSVLTMSYIAYVWVFSIGLIEIKTCYLLVLFFLSGCLGAITSDS